MTPWEIEAKLTPRRAADAHAIATLRKIGRYELRALPAQHLRTIYLDTPTFSLARRGIALRVRRAGRAWEATAKWGGQVNGAVHHRPELTVPLDAPPHFPFTLPPGPLAMQLTAVVAGAPIKPIFITEIERQRRLVVAHQHAASPIAELDIDRVTLRRPRQRPVATPYWEVEIELRDGAERDVSQLAQVLRRRFKVAPSRDSKFTRSLRLFHPRVVQSDDRQPITASDTVNSAARKIVAKQLARLQRHDPATRSGNDAEALHDMRVATRRLRAAVRAFKPGFPKPLRRVVKRHLSWLADVLGGVRDVDVQLVHLSRQRKARNEATLELLRQHLLARGRQRRAPLEAALNSPRYAQLIAALDAFATTTEPDATGPPASWQAHRALHKALARFLDDGRIAAQDPQPELLHALRISAKRLRYVLEFFKEMTGRSGSRLTKALIELQDILGMQHDSVVAQDTTRQVLRATGAQSGGAGLRAFAAAQQRDADRYRRRAQALWKRSRTPMIKDMQAILARLDRAGDEDA